MRPVQAGRIPDDGDGPSAVYEELPGRYERQDWVVLGLILSVIVVAAIVQHGPLALFLLGD